MSGKNKKQFGVWMDLHSATIVGKEEMENGEFIILGNVKNSGQIIIPMEMLPTIRK